MTFSWQGSGQLTNYKILFFDDLATLQAWVAAQNNPSPDQGTGAGNEVCTGTGNDRTCKSAPPEAQPAPFFTDVASGTAYTIADSQIGPCNVQHPAQCKTFVTGELVVWMVVATDPNGNTVLSDARSAALEPTRESLNSLPEYFDIGGFRVYVDTYQSGAGPNNLTGQGKTYFMDEGGNARTPIPLSFQALKADLLWELQPAGGVHRRPGKGGVPIDKAVLKATITSGDIHPRFSHPLALNFMGYELDLKSLWLRSAQSRASADFTLQVPYVGMSGNAAVTLDNTSLEPGGDFYREVGGASLPAISLGGVTISQVSKLVVAFSKKNTYAVPVVAINGKANFDVAKLFAVTDAASIKASYAELDLSPAGPFGTLKVEGSTPIHPVVPGGSELTVTGGTMTISSFSGSTEDFIPVRDASLDGTVQLPTNLRSSGGLSVSGTFKGLKHSGDWYVAASSSYIANLQLGQIEWGNGDKPFRLLNASGVLTISAAGDLSAGGITITQGYLESPFDVMLPQTGTSFSDDVNLSVGASGVSGTITSSTGLNTAPARNTMIGGFSASVRLFQISFINNAVGSSAISGNLIVPKPADFTVGFSDATITSTGDILGPKLKPANTIPLNYWHAELSLPGQTAAPAMSLSRSYLQVNSGTLNLLVDQQFGGNEFDAFSITTMSIGANGQIQSAQVGQSSRFLGMDFQLDSSDLSFSDGNEQEPVGMQPLVTLAGQLSFPSFGQKHVTVQHTASGADITEITPADLHRGNGKTMKTSAKVQWVNGYAKGMTDKDGNGFKEFIGLGQVVILQMLYLNGVIMIGDDSQGSYDTMALGIGVDVNKAYALYSGGWVSVGAKLGAAGLDYAANGKSTQADNVAGLVGDIAALKNKFDAGSLLRTVADAVKLADGIYIDNGGQKNDDVDTSLSLAAFGLGVAQTLSQSQGSTTNPNAVTVAVLKGLELALPILEKAKFVDQNTITVLKFVQLGVTAGRMYADNGTLSDRDATTLAKQVMDDAKLLSTDPNFVIPVEVVGSAIALATSKDLSAGLQMASAILGTIRDSGAISGQDASNVLTLGQALLDSTAQAKELPTPNNVLTIASSVMDTASGDGMNYGSADDKTVKLALKLGSSTLKAVALLTNGMDYDQAGQMVKAAFTATNPPAGADSPGTQVTNLLNVWTSLKTASLSDSLDALMKNFVCANQVETQNCASTEDAAVTQAVQAIDAGMKPDDLVWPMQWLSDTKDQASKTGSTADFNTAFNQHQTDVDQKSAALINTAVENIKNAGSSEDFSKAAGIYEKLASSRKNLGLADTGYVSEAQAAVDAQMQGFATEAITLINQAEAYDDVQKAAVAYKGHVRARNHMFEPETVTPAPGSEAFCTATQQKTSKFITDWTNDLNQTTDYDVATDRIQKLQQASRGYELIGCDDSNVPTIWTLLTAAKPAIQNRQKELSQDVANATDPKKAAEATKKLIEFEIATKRESDLTGTDSPLVPQSNLFDANLWCIKHQHDELKVWLEDDQAHGGGSYDQIHEQNMQKIKEECEALYLTNSIVGSSPSSQLNSRPAYSLLRSNLSLAGGVKGALAVPASLVLLPRIPAQVGDFPATSKSTIEGWYNNAVNNLPNAKELEDAAQGLWLYTSVYTAPLGTDLGYSDAEKQQHANTLQPLLMAVSPIMMSDALTRITSVSAADQLSGLVEEYKLWADFSGASTQGFNNVVSSWVTATAQVPCSKQDQLSGQLQSPELSLLSAGNKDAVQSGLKDMFERCGSPDAAVADQGTNYAAALAKGSGDLETLISSLGTRLQNGESEASLKEALAWSLAQQISDLTQAFSGGGSDEAKALWQVHQQAAYVVAYKSKSTTEMIAGALDIISNTIGDLVPQQRNIAAAISTGLKGYLSNSGQGSTVLSTLQLVASLADAFMPDSPAKKVVEGAYIGLASANSGSLTVTSAIDTGLQIASGIGLAYSEKLVRNGDQIDFAASFSQLDQNGGTFWQSVGKDIPAVLSLADTLNQLMGLVQTLNKASTGNPAQVVAASKAFLSNASKLPKIGQFFAVLTQPEQNLQAPDTDRQNYFQNLLLAELDTARKSLPSATSVAFKSTCPSIDPSQGLQGGSLGGNGGLFCAIDLARDLIDSEMVGVVDPSSPEGMNEQAGQEVTQMKKDAVYAQAIGDENLSGIYGAITYRNGQLSQFKLVASFTIKGFMEAAMDAQWDDGQKQFTLQYDSADERDPGLLADLGLIKGANRLFDNRVDLGSPIKTLFLQVTPNAFAGRIDLSLNTPFGGYETGEQDLAIGFNPFSFDVKATLNYQVAVIYSIKPSVELSYQNGNGGLNVSAAVNVQPPAPFGPVYIPPRVCAAGACAGGDAEGRGDYSHWWGAYATANLGVGLNGGISGLQTNGIADGEAGIYQTEKDQPHCSGNFQQTDTWPDANGNQIAYGNCYYGQDQKLDFLTGTDYKDFYLKLRTSVGVSGFGSIGLWIYGGNGGIDAGTGDFPSKYGGWSSSSGGNQ